MHLDLWHGTNQEFDTFDEKMLGFHTRNSAAESAFFFAMKQETAVHYAHGAASKLLPDQVAHEAIIAGMVEEANKAVRSGDHDAYERIVLEMEDLDLGAIQADPAGARTLRCSVEVNNPLEVYADNADVIVDLGGVLRAARDKGHDAVIILEIIDTPSGEGPVDTHIAVFSPDQIKILEVVHECDFPEFFDKEDEPGVEMALAM